MHTFEAYDISGEPLTWSVNGTNANIFEINANGELSFGDGSKPAYISPNDTDNWSDGANTYELTVEALMLMVTHKA